MRTLTKQTKILFLIVCSFFLSCGTNLDDIDFGPKNGIALVFFNYTDIEYTGYKFYIGAVKNNKFIATGSVDVKSIIWSIKTAPSENMTKNDETGEKIARSYGGFVEAPSFEDGRWQPDYDKIKAISNEYTYKLRLSDGREQVFMEQLENFDKFTVGLTTFDIKKDTIIYRR
ncbi:hypothetical protein [Tenacibaculum finnmarkense]|uniref:hypothetical protein n=1 Tax=Tenacibaculum finnmarkense TaxID=2781243 RepID=UPI000C69EE30|nr:hypothetical protein [Tenacibaculum finnmarkense]MCD8440005.1 hypothetical protein [Tenacibaculum finnmarkense genomovar ulcerans]MCG8721073.1 hypothetical protein [Tenacibaculum finnmarkense]SOS54996.1 exported hypothetical protein [Tenacibaculum finnmarkense]